MVAVRFTKAAGVMAVALGTPLALLAACSGDGGASSGGVDAEDAAPRIVRPFTCVGPWICGGTPGTLVPTPTKAGCELRGFTPPLVLADDGTLREGERTVGNAYGSGDGVMLNINGERKECRGASEATRACQPHCGYY